MPVLNLSDLLAHNDEAQGYWLLIDGMVYDVTRFMDKHPGGRTILINSAGRDATSEFQAVAHHQNPAIVGMLRRYVIGYLRTLDFADPQAASLYSQCLGLADLVVDMQNTLRSDLGFLGKQCTGGEEQGQPDAYKTDLLFDLQERFITVYVASLAHRLQALPATGIDTAAIQEAAGHTLKAVGALHRWHAGQEHADPLHESPGRRCTAPPGAIQVYEMQIPRHQLALMAEVKQVVVAMLQAFEAGTPAESGLASSLQALPQIGRHLLLGLNAMQEDAKAALDDLAGLRFNVCARRGTAIAHAER